MRPSAKLPLLILVCLIGLSAYADADLLDRRYISSYGQVDYQFFRQFHTGCTENDIIQSVPEWIPIRPYLKYVWLEEGFAHFNGDGSVVSLSCLLEFGGSEYLVTPDVTVHGLRERCLAIWQEVPQVIPIIELSYIDNVATLSYDQLKTYIFGLSSWLRDYGKQCLLVIGGEFNFPQSMDGWGKIQDINGSWVSKKISATDYNRVMMVARMVIDTEGIDNVFLASHANILDFICVDGQWFHQDWLTEFQGLEEYYDGMREAHVLGFSFYYDEPELSAAWNRIRVIRDNVGGSKPVLFIEYANKIWWDPYPTCTPVFVDLSYGCLNEFDFIEGISWCLNPSNCSSETFNAIARNAQIWEGK